ncbi:insulin-like growth factor 1 receptor [Paramuricea clavata]|uniref:Insulin-like growth factor 1 receptor n=1 Tax=Paramuricea clavata TaxID=317549 RepID=A0A7D9DH87_PARCT|nr:insulin-like growth factor 1 receptor [Paramuricea clavata]
MYILNDCFAQTVQVEKYADPAYFGISYGSSSRAETPPINSRTGCIANGCVGECLNASDIAAPLDVQDGTGYFIKEFIPASSSDILKLSELQFPSLAVITERIVHDEKLELITEVGDMGTLEEFIKSFGCPVEDAITYLSQIGEAVLFLHNRRFIHRNLRAASIFIDSNGNTKLACLGRVRKVKPNPDDLFSTMPIKLSMSDDSLRWSSPEVITDGMFSKASDVWAFAVLIWEIFTLIDKDLDESDEEISHLPYHQLTSKDLIFPYLNNGQRLGKPKNCPDALYEMMLQCWEFCAEDRLRCQDVVQRIEEQVCLNVYS